MNEYENVFLTFVKCGYQLVIGTTEDVVEAIREDMEGKGYELESYEILCD